MCWAVLGRISIFINLAATDLVICVVISLAILVNYILMAYALPVLVPLLAMVL